MSANNSKRLLEAKIEYKKGLLETENKTTVESIKPVEKKSVSSRILKQGRSLFQKLVAATRTDLERDYAHELANRKAIASFMKIDTRNQKATETTL